MKKVILILCLCLLCMTGVSWAIEDAKTTRWVYTINNTDIDEVQEEIIDVFLDNSFDIGHQTGNKLIMTKTYDGFLGIGASAHAVQFNMIKKGNNVKVTCFEQSVGTSIIAISGKSDLTKLVPLFKEVKHRIDGTPYDKILNEVKTAQTRQAEREDAGNKANMKFKDTSDGVVEVKQQKDGELFKEVVTTEDSKGTVDNTTILAKRTSVPQGSSTSKSATQPKPKKESAKPVSTPSPEQSENLAGIIIEQTKTSIGHFTVQDIIRDGRAEQAGLIPGDRITDVNLRGTAQFADGAALMAYFNERLTRKLPITLTIQRDGQAIRLSIRY